VVPQLLQQLQQPLLLLKMEKRKNQNLQKKNYQKEKSVMLLK
jgi:hypothetical protein